jgi:hypothetical protein
LILNITKEASNSLSIKSAKSTMDLPYTTLDAFIQRMYNYSIDNSKNYYSIYANEDVRVLQNSIYYKLRIILFTYLFMRAFNNAF